MIYGVYIHIMVNTSGFVRFRVASTETITDYREYTTTGPVIGVRADPFSSKSGGTVM